MGRFAAMVLAFWASTAAAATEDGRLDSIVADAEGAVHGVVIEVQTWWDGNAARSRYTVVPVEVFCDGQPTGEPWRITLPGGIEGERRMRIPGVPVFGVGDEVLVFVDRGHHPLLDGVLGVEGDALVGTSARPDDFPRDIPELRARVTTCDAAPDATRRVRLVARG